MSSPYTGAVLIGEDLSMNSVWFRLHQNAISWGDIFKETSQSSDLEMLNGHDLRSMRDLKSLDVKSWWQLCEASGHTVYGAVALSWCKDAKPFQVFESWEASGFPLKPLPKFVRPAQLMNPTIFPQTSSLQAIVKATYDMQLESQHMHLLAICAAIAALKEPLVFDMHRDQLIKAEPQIASFLKFHMLQKPDRLPEEEAYLATWTTTIGGSEFDVWEGT